MSRPRGLNIVDFTTKSISLRLSNFASVRDSVTFPIRNYLARYFVGNRLTKFNTWFNFTSNNIPSCSLPSHFYRLCLDEFAYLYTSYNCLPDDLSCKNTSRLMLNENKKNDILWLIIHHAVKVRYAL